MKCGVSFVSAIIKTVHSCTQYGIVQYFTTIRAIVSKKKLKNELCIARGCSLTCIGRHGVHACYTFFLEAQDVWVYTLAFAQHATDADIMCMLSIICS